MTDDDGQDRQTIGDVAAMRHRLTEAERLLAEYRRDRDRLRDREELYRQLVENSQGLICKHDLEGNLLYVSPASALELGYPPEAGARRNLREFLAPAAQPFFPAYLERIRQKEADHGLLHLARRDGEERLWAYRNILYRPVDGEPYVVGHAVDITDRVRMDRLLRESEQRHRAVIEALEEGVVFMVAEGTIKAWNPSAERILGVTGDELRRAAPRSLGCEVVQEDGSPLAVDEYPSSVTLRTGQPCSGVAMAIRRPDGEMVWVSASSRPLRRPGEDLPYGVVLSFVDVTERRRVERQREQDLADALAKIKVLDGLLSICASCKKIRDRTGTWWPLEVYIQDHSEAAFSHGLCRDCAEAALREFMDGQAADGPPPGA
jgi:PAS domain S-box-containing protein